MNAPQLKRLLTDKPLLLAMCETLCKSMNGKSMWRLTFLLEDLAIGGELFYDDEKWLKSGLHVAERRRNFWEGELERLEADGISVIASTDSGYPRNLRLVNNGPPVLFVKGTLVERDHRAVAIVGTRKPSNEGQNLATELSSGFAKHGYTVVSGLAAGIDTAAHAAALNAGGRTIAVFGTGITKVYPSQNRTLAAHIARKGACVSQFFPTTPASRWTFPARNITCSGLSMATVVVEASETSGARLQAQEARKHGKSVFLVERLVTSQPWARELLKEPGSVEVANDADTIVEQLERYLADLYDDALVFDCSAAA